MGLTGPTLRVIISVLRYGDNLMRRQYIKNQSQVKVIAQTKNNIADTIRYALLAAVSAGVFYFFGHNLWYTLAGG